MRVTSSRSTTSPAARSSPCVNTFEVEGGDKPVCVAEQVSRLYTGG